MYCCIYILYVLLFFCRYVNIWDGYNKKRLCQFHRYPTSIASLSFANDGSSGHTFALCPKILQKEHSPLKPLPLCQQFFAVCPFS